MSFLSSFIHDSADVDIQSHIESLGSNLLVYPIRGEEVYFHFNPRYVPSSNKLYTAVTVSPYNLSHFNTTVGTGREDWTRLRRPTESETRRFIWNLERMLEHHRTRVLPMEDSQVRLVQDVLSLLVR